MPRQTGARCREMGDLSRGKARSGRRPADNLHYLYGASVIVTLPLVASYIADKRFSRPLAYGLATLFMAGLAIRAITTGGPV